MFEKFIRSFLMILMLLMTACGDNEGLPSQPDQLRVVGLAIYPVNQNKGTTEVRLTLDSTVQYEAIATYNDGSTSVVTDLVQWQSDNNEIVQIDIHGSAIAQKIGDGYVSAYYHGIKSNKSHLIINEATVVRLQITPSTLSLAKGASQQYNVKAVYSDNTIRNVTNSVTWKVDNTAIVGVDSNGVANALSVGDTYISATFNGVTSENKAHLTVTNEVLTSLQVTPAIATLSKGNYQQYHVIATYSDHSTQDVTKLVSWNSDISAVLFDKLGYANAKRTGVHQLSAQYNGVKSNTVSLTVTNAVMTSIQVTPAIASVAKGRDQQYVAIATYSDQTTLDVTYQAHWNSTNNDSADISYLGLTHAMEEGDSIITATFNGIKSNSAALKVTAATVESIQITPADKSIAKGVEQAYTAIATYSDKTTQDVSDFATWYSSNRTAATINISGVAHALSIGETQIQAIFDDVSSNTATLRVTDATVSSIQVTPAAASIAKGTQQQYSAIATYSDGTTQDITNLASWNSNDINIATIDEYGVAQAVALGTSAITASFNGVSSTNNAQITVTAATVRALHLIYNNYTSAKGSDFQFAVIATYSDGSTQDVTNQVAWNSSNPNVRTITAGGLGHAVSVGSSTITAYLNGVSSAPITLDVTPAVVTSLQVSTGSMTLAKGTEQQYSAVATYSDGTTQDVSSLVAWNSSDVSIATISTSGIGHAVSEGNTQVSAIFEGRSSNSVELSVTAATVSELQISYLSPSLAKGTTQQYTAIATYSDGTSQDVTTLVAWNSGDTAIATITNSGLGSAVAVGSTVISASMDNTDPNLARVQSNELTLDVTQAVITSLQIISNNTSIANGTYTQYSAIATYSDGTTQDVSGLVNWNSSNAATVTIDMSGLVHATAEGSAQISAYLDGVTSNTSLLNVTPAVVTALQVTPANNSVAKGVSAQYTAIATYSDKTTQVVTDNVAWYSNNTAVATISMSGLVNTITQGESVISASLNGIASNSASLTVTPAVVTSLQITSTLGDIAKGTSTQYTAVATYSDNTTQVVSESLAWNSSNTNIATISMTGNVIGINEGSVDITANLNGVTSNTATLTVTPAVVRTLQVTPAIVSIAKGTDRQYVAIATYTDNTTQDVSSSVHWNSNDTAKATITMSGYVHAVAEGAVEISARLGDVVSNNAQLTVTPAVVSSLQITPAVNSIAKGTNAQYIAVATYSDNTTQVINDHIAWNSSNTNVATILSNGQATAVGIGNSTIQATFNGISSNTATLTVTVATVVSLQVTPAIANIAKGTVEQYNATAVYTDHTTQNVTALVAWNSSNTAIATIDPVGLARGVIVGNASISATLNGVVSNVATLTVRAAEITSIQVTPTTATIAKGTYQQYQAVAAYTDGTYQNITNQVAWNSSNTNTATISAGGLAHAINVGDSTIKATFNGVSSVPVSLNISAATVTSLVITPNSVTIPQGSAVQYTAVATYTDATTQDVTMIAAWNSSSNSVATVSTTGVVTGVSTGQATITAMFHSIISNNSVVTVPTAVVTLKSITIHPKNAYTVVGRKESFTATGLYSDDTSVDLTTLVSWRSENTAIATISDSGTATAVSLGEVAIHAHYSDVDASAKLTVLAKGRMLSHFNVGHNQEGIEWDDANNYCNSLNPTANSRLPTEEELRTLFVDATSANAAKPDSGWKRNEELCELGWKCEDHFWTSTESNSQSHITVTLDEGGAYSRDDKDPATVACIQ